MIGIKPIVMEKERALQEYKACKEALKKKRDPETIQLQKLYYHAMKGHKIIDIFEAFKFAGLNDKNEPRLWYKEGRKEATKEIIEKILKHKNCLKYHYDDYGNVFTCLDIVLKECGYKEKNSIPTQKNHKQLIRACGEMEPYQT